MKGLPGMEAQANSLRAIMQACDDVLNPVKPRTVGLIILQFDYGDHEDGRCNYASNGADRRDTVKLLRETADRLEKQGFAHAMDYKDLAKK